MRTRHWQGAKHWLLFGYKEERKTSYWTDQADTLTTLMNLLTLNSGTTGYGDPLQLLQSEGRGTAREAVLSKKINPWRQGPNIRSMALCWYYIGDYSLQCKVQDNGC